ncbi:MAG: AraC family transcriptional regulator [Bacteroidia bacterium]
MKIFINRMVNKRCETFVLKESIAIGIPIHFISCNCIQIINQVSRQEFDSLMKILKINGLIVIKNSPSGLIERIKESINEIVYVPNEVLLIKFSHYLSQKLKYNYTYLANLFSAHQGVSIEQYLIAKKIERIKTFILFGKYNFSEIAIRMNYSSAAHLSHQFKKVTGHSPSDFKHLKRKSLGPTSYINSYNIKPVTVSVN